MYLVSLCYLLCSSQLLELEWKFLLLIVSRGIVIFELIHAFSPICLRQYLCSFQSNPANSLELIHSSLQVSYPSQMPQLKPNELKSYSGFLWSQIAFASFYHQFFHDRIQIIVCTHQVIPTNLLCLRWVKPFELN